jgi:hypothetical protein
VVYRRPTIAQVFNRILNSLYYWYCCMYVLLTYFIKSKLDPTNSDSPRVMLWPATACGSCVAACGPSDRDLKLTQTVWYGVPSEARAEG